MRQGVAYLLAITILVPLYNSEFLLSAFDGEIPSAATYGILRSAILFL